MQNAHFPSTLQRTVDVLVSGLAPERIILFGSWAKGTVNRKSDIDLLVLGDVAGDPEFHLRRVRQLVRSSFPPVDVVFCTPEDVRQARTGKLPFILAALESGIVLYFA
jgi:uncharacterized protein